MFRFSIEITEAECARLRSCHLLTCQRRYTVVRRIPHWTFRCIEERSDSARIETRSVIQINLNKRDIVTYHSKLYWCPCIANYIAISTPAFSSVHLKSGRSDNVVCVVFRYWYNKLVDNYDLRLIYPSFAYSRSLCHIIYCLSCTIDDILQM